MEVNGEKHKHSTRCPKNGPSVVRVNHGGEWHDDALPFLRSFSTLDADAQEQVLVHLLQSIPSPTRANIFAKVVSVKAFGFDEGNAQATTMYESTHGGVFGCPWCRRPLELTPPHDSTSTPVTRTSKAFCALLYGDTWKYFFGALVLGWGLRHEPYDRVLVLTEDVSASKRTYLEKVGWKLHPVSYLNGAEEVSSNLFHGVWHTRFRSVFTKIQVLGLPYDQVVLMDLDLVVRKPLKELMDLPWPAAHARGDPSLEHGECVPYRRFWENYEKRQWNGEVEELPRHQQCSGINAGVMVLPGNRPDLLHRMGAELSDWNHPEHYPTYMPEQEYLGRWFGTFEGPWTHVGCEYNYEIDKDVRVPFDFSAAHKRYKEDHTLAIEKLAVVHFSGSYCKPWDRLFKDDIFRPDDVDESVPDDPLMGIFFREWFRQFRDACDMVGFPNTTE